MFASLSFFHEKSAKNQHFIQKRIVIKRKMKLMNNQLNCSTGIQEQRPYAY